VVAPTFISTNAAGDLLIARRLGTGEGYEQDLGGGDTLGLGGIDRLDLGEPRRETLDLSTGQEPLFVGVALDDAGSLLGVSETLPLRARADYLPTLETLDTGFDVGVATQDAEEEPAPTAEPVYLVADQGTETPEELADRPWLTHTRDRVVTHAGDYIVFPASGNDPIRRAPGRDFFEAGAPLALQLSPFIRPGRAFDTDYRYVETLDVIRVDDPEPRAAMEELTLVPGVPVRRTYAFRDAYGPIRVARMRFAATDGVRVLSAAGTLPGGTAMILSLELVEGSGPGLFILTGVAPLVWQRYIELLPGSP
jgi:hypothetical protein